MKNIILLLLIIGFSSCGVVKIKSPSSRYMVPETQGKLFDGNIYAHQQVGTEGTLYLDQSELDETLELRNNVSSLNIGTNLGILDKLDISLVNNTDAPLMTYLKFQVIGPSRREAKKNDQSFALALGYGKSEFTQTQSDNDLFDGDDDVNKSKILHDMYDFSALYGYRVQDDVLFYSSLSLTKQRLLLDIIEADEESIEKEYNFHTTNLGANLGVVRYFNDYFAHLEFSAQSTNWTHNDRTTYAFLSLAVGYNWN